MDLYHNYAHRYWIYCTTTALTANLELLYFSLWVTAVLVLGGLWVGVVVVAAVTWLTYVYIYPLVGLINLGHPPHLRKKMQYMTLLGLVSSHEIETKGTYLNNIVIEIVYSNSIALIHTMELCFWLLYRVHAFYGELSFTRGESKTRSLSEEKRPSANLPAALHEVFQDNGYYMFTSECFQCIVDDITCIVCFISVA